SSTGAAAPRSNTGSRRASVSIGAGVRGGVGGIPATSLESLTEPRPVTPPADSIDIAGGGGVASVDAGTFRRRSRASSLFANNNPSAALAAAAAAAAAGASSDPSASSSSSSASSLYVPQTLIATHGRKRSVDLDGGANGSHDSRHTNGTGVAAAAVSGQ